MVMLSTVFGQLELTRKLYSSYFREKYVEHSLPSTNMSTIPSHWYNFRGSTSLPWLVSTRLKIYFGEQKEDQWMIIDV